MMGSHEMGKGDNTGLAREGAGIHRTAHRFGVIAYRFIREKGDVLEIAYRLGVLVCLVIIAAKLPSNIYFPGTIQVEGTPRQYQTPIKVDVSGRVDADVSGYVNTR